jgi:hypothetical protein
LLLPIAIQKVDIAVFLFAETVGRFQKKYSVHETENKFEKVWMPHSTSLLPGVCGGARWGTF